jgi:hypothetical protein
MSIETVIIIGMPKCGTSYLSTMLRKSNNFNLIYSSQNKRECDDAIFDTTDYNYKFAKNPFWIFSRLFIEKLVNHFKNINTKVLLCVCIREFNEQLKSFYNMKKRNGKLNGESYGEFINNVSYDISQIYSVKEATLQIKENILYLIELIEQIDNISLFIIDHKDICNNNVLKIFKNLDVDIKYDNYEKNKFVSKTVVEKDTDINNAYISLISDTTIQKYLFNHDQ